MTKLTYANVQVDNLLSQMDTVMTVTTELLKDQSFSLEDRWELYLKIEKLLPVESYCGRAIDKLVDNLCDEVFPDGRGVRYNSQIDEGIVENYEYWSDRAAEGVDDEYWAEDMVPVKRQYEKRDAWREAVLAEGRGLVVFDW